jgi:hypothetical protein
MLLKHTTDSLRLVEFCQKHSGWHSFATDKKTRKALERASILGQVEVNRFGQFRGRTPDIDVATGIAK